MCNTSINGVCTSYQYNNIYIRSKGNTIFIIVQNNEINQLLS